MNRIKGFGFALGLALTSLAAAGATAHADGWDSGQRDGGQTSVSVRFGTTFGDRGQYGFDRHHRDGFRQQRMEWSNSYGQRGYGQGGGYDQRGYGRNTEWQSQRVGRHDGRQWNGGGQQQWNGGDRHAGARNGDGFDRDGDDGRVDGHANGN